MKWEDIVLVLIKYFWNLSPDGTMYSTFTNHIFNMVKMHFEVKRVSMIAINSKDMAASNFQVYHTIIVH